TFSAADEIANAHVYLDSANGQRTDCPFDGHAHRCPFGNLYVAAEWHEIHFSPQRCLWMHPPRGATRLVAEFSTVAGWNQLVLRGGLVWDREYLRQGSSAHVRVETGEGRTLIDLNIPPATPGLQRVEVPGDAKMATRTLRLIVSSENPE